MVYKVGGKKRGKKKKSERLQPPWAARKASQTDELTNPSYNPAAITSTIESTQGTSLTSFLREPGPLTKFETPWSFAPSHATVLAGFPKSPELLRTGHT